MPHRILVKTPDEKFHPPTGLRISDRGLRIADCGLNLAHQGWAVGAGSQPALLRVSG